MRTQKGFSLIELLIVVAIILIIAAIAIPNLLRARIAANESSAVSSVRTINTAQVTYQSSYPTVGFASTIAARVTRAIGASVAKPSVSAGSPSCCSASHHRRGSPATSVSISRNPVTRGGASTPIGSRPIGPGNQCRVTKKIQISTSPIQNCGSAMPLSVTPR